MSLRPCRHFAIVYSPNPPQLRCQLKLTLVSSRQRHFLLRPGGSPVLRLSPCHPTCFSPTPHQQPMGEHCQRRCRQDSPGERNCFARSTGICSTFANDNNHRSLVPSSMVSRKLLQWASHGLQQPSASFTDNCTVKFDTAKLPPILNSLETDNNGQKLVLEVAVRTPSKFGSIIISIIN